MKAYTRNNLSNNTTGNLVFYLTAAFLFFAFCLVVGSTVYSKEAVENRQIEEYYRGREQEMVKQVRAYLNENGFRNSGVSLTHVVEQNSKRAYTLTVHHDRIDRLEDGEKEALRKELCGFGFDNAFCEFNCEFLEL